VAEEPGAEQSQAGPSEDELLQALDRVGVADVIVQALAASASIGFRRVSPEARDLPQARLAIESIRALEPVLRDCGVEDALVRDLEQARVNLQLAYAKAVSEEGSPAPEAETQDRGQAEA
jgi:biotin carboxylase